MVRVHYWSTTNLVPRAFLLFCVASFTIVCCFLSFLSVIILVKCYGRVGKSLRFRIYFELKYQRTLTHAFKGRGREVKREQGERNVTDILTMPFLLTRLTLEDFCLYLCCFLSSVEEYKTLSIAKNKLRVAHATRANLARLLGSPPVKREMK